MYCPNCGESIDDRAVVCVKCGCPVKMRDPNASPKSRLVTLLLCLFIGWLGVHRFYAGRVGSGVAIILTLGGFLGIWPFIDLLVIVCGSFKDGQGKIISNWEEV